MSNPISRRDALVLITSSAFLTPALAQHVHEQAAEAKSLSGGANFAPKYLSKHQFDTMRALAELIVPADDHSPGATEAGAAEFIDHLCSINGDLGVIFTGGLMWMDDYMIRKYDTAFLESKPDQQIALLNNIAYKNIPDKEHAAKYSYGQKFFVWARNITQDAFYTSPVGIKDLGFMGNTVVAEFSVPKEAVDYAMKRSPFGKG